jgi:hypothetical protein
MMIIKHRTRQHAGGTHASTRHTPIKDTRVNTPHPGKVKFCSYALSGGCFCRNNPFSDPRRVNKGVNICTMCMGMRGFCLPYVFCPFLEGLRGRDLRRPKLGSQQAGVNNG